MLICFLFFFKEDWSKLNAYNFDSHLRSQSLKTTVQKDTYIPMFTATLFTIAKTWKQPKCPSVDEQIKMWYICTMEYYPAIKNE